MSRPDGLMTLYEAFPYTNEHLYTTKLSEYNSLGSQGWIGEGQKFYSETTSGKPFYRLYNPWGSGVTAHHYTDNADERSTLLRQGWTDDGPCWYGL